MRPAVDEERGIVAFASFDKSIYVLDVATGRKLGTWETGEICYTTPLILGNRLFCGSGDRHLYVIDLDRMELVRKLDVGARVYSSPCAIGTRVLFGTTGGKLFEIDADTLETKGLLQLPDAITNAIVPSPDGRRLYISTYIESSLCVREAARRATVNDCRFPTLGPETARLALFPSRFCVDADLRSKLNALRTFLGDDYELYLNLWRSIVAPPVSKCGLGA